MKLHLKIKFVNSIPTTRQKQNNHDNNDDDLT